MSRWCLLGVLCAGWIASCGDAAEIDPDTLQSPILDGGGGYEKHRPEIYRDGWIDLNKNGRRDTYEDPSKSADERIEDLLRQMTLAEKLGQLQQLKLVADVDQRDAARVAAGGVGSYLGAGSQAGLRNRLQREAVEDSRLGVPLIFGFDTIHGFRTIFPIPLALSTSWDPQLVERVCAVAARESAAAGVDWVFAPMVDIARDARWGRIAEGFGEDPWLTSQMAAAAVHGFQGRGGHDGTVAACLKHFVGYGAAEGGRDYNAVEIGLPTLRNTYLPPFRAGVDAGAETLMSAFETINTMPASANRFTLTDVLRGEWGFRGFVVSDWNAVIELVHHGLCADKREAAAAAMVAGVDMEMLSDCYHTELPGLIDAHEVPAATVDDAVRRILRVKLKQGLFERPFADAAEPALDRTLAREAAAASCVLLRNRGVLPLVNRPQTIAVVGPLADSGVSMLGTWAAHGRAETVATLRQALGEALPQATITWVKGCEITADTPVDLAAVQQAVRSADLVICALGEPARWSGEDKFRSDLGLPRRQQELFDAVAQLGKPIVSLMFSGRPLAVPTLVERSDAVLLAWHPGIEAGPAVADVITGRRAPSARLTTTVPRYVGQVPIYYDHTATGRPLNDYRDLTRAPLFPFGFGLTYTQFRYGPTRVTGEFGDGKTLKATVEITNIGQRAGTEVAQLYIRARSRRTGVRPVRELKGYRRVALEPGQSATVEFALTAAELGWIADNGQLEMTPGRYGAVIAPNAGEGEMIELTIK